MSQEQKVITAEEYQEIWATVQAMSPEERDALQAALMDKLARRRRVEVDGKATSLKRMERQLEEQRRLFEAGAFDPTHRSMPRWQKHLCIPGQALRPGAYKQQLRWWEEAELELDLFGQGASFSPRPVVGMLGGGRRDFAWGIYARTEQAEQVLSKRWARRGSQPVADPELYLDVLRNCLNMELTLMVVTSRPLPLADMRQTMAAKLEGSMQALSGGGELPAQERVALQDFVHAFDDKRVAPAGWMDAKRGCIKPDTQFIFSTTNKGDLAVEAITPGRLKDRKTSRITVNRSTLLTASVFNLFLGSQPLDEEGKKDVGHAMVWAANGFRFRPWEMKEGQYIAERGPDGEIRFPRPPSEQLALPLRPSVFQLLDDGTQPLCRMLLGAVSQAAQQDLAGA